MESNGQSVFRFIAVQGAARVSHERALLIPDRNHYPALHRAFTGEEADPELRRDLLRDAARLEIGMVDDAFQLEAEWLVVFGYRLRGRLRFFGGLRRPACQREISDTPPRTKLIYSTARSRPYSLWMKIGNPLSCGSGADSSRRAVRHYAEKPRRSVRARPRFGTEFFQDLEINFDLFSHTVLLSMKGLI